MSITPLSVIRRDLLAEELEAMAAVGRALDSLSDGPARQRVLRWAAERYANAEKPAPVEVSTIGSDASLDLEGLDEFFDDGRERAREGLELVASKKPA